MVFFEVTETDNLLGGLFSGINTWGCRVYTYASNLSDQVATKYVLFLSLLLIWATFDFKV